MNFLRYNEVVLHPISEIFACDRNCIAIIISEYHSVLDTLYATLYAIYYNEKEISEISEDK